MTLLIDTNQGPASSEMISPAVYHRQFKEKREGALQHPPGKGMALEHKSHADAGAERLLKEIAVHSGCRVGLLEVRAVANSEALINVLVDQSLALPIGDVEGIETKLQADPLIQFPRILDVGIDSGCCRCAPEVAAAVQRDLSGVLISLLSS